MKETDRKSQNFVLKCEKTDRKNLKETDRKFG